MSLSPDELDALADAAGWMASYRRGDTDEIPGGQEMVQRAARLKEIAPALARDLAALQRWAEKAEEALRDVGCEKEWDANRTPCDYGDDEREWCRRCALLAEYAEMKERE